MYVTQGRMLLRILYGKLPLSHSHITQQIGIRMLTESRVLKDAKIYEPNIFILTQGELSHS
jgi:hypothetical protein